MFSGTGFKKYMHNKYGSKQKIWFLMGKINKFFGENYTKHVS